MIPSFIRVFPGLRMSTAHVEHLQAALLTGVEELRAVLSPARVVDGMEVALTDAATARVGPGLAFDRLGRRIALVEAQEVDLSDLLDLLPAETPPVLYARHALREEGEVEGVATLVFDACELGIAAELPEDAVALALLGEAEGAPVLLEEAPAEAAESAPSEAPPEAPVPPPVATGGTAREAEPRALSPGAAPQPLDEIPLSLPWPGAALTLQATLALDAGEGPVAEAAATGEAVLRADGTLVQFATTDWRLAGGGQGRELEDDVLLFAPAAPGVHLRLVAALPGPVLRLQALRDPGEAVDPAAPPPKLGWRLKLRWRALPLGPEPPAPPPAPPPAGPGGTPA